AASGAGAPGGGRRELPEDRQAGHDSQRCVAADRGGCGDVSGAGGWGAVDVRARAGPPDGPALLPILKWAMKTGHLRRCLLAPSCGVAGPRLGRRSSAPSIWPVWTALSDSPLIERYGLRS